MLSTLVDALGTVFFVTEMFLLVKRRSGSQSESDGSLRMLWRVLGGGVCLTLGAKWLMPYPVFVGQAHEMVSLVMILSGSLLRWISIAYLGKQFTVNVSIVADHLLVTTGPYKYVRHPSYTGLLLTFFGLAIHSNHPVGLVVLTAPAVFAVLKRIKIEESVMRRAFGEQYGEYCARVNILIPGIY